MLKRIMELVKIAILNAMIGILSFIFKRDENVWLFGAWMGLRFADNSRFLFQYLHENKSRLNLKRVIWVSADKEIVDELRNFGYECYYMQSWKSIYWHLRAGVHVVCNMYYRNNSGYNGDINGLLSAGAKKIQLWHGVGIKACGKLIPKGTIYEQHNRIISFFSNTSLMNSAVLSPGCWKNRYHLVTSRENARVAICDYGVREDRIIYANYPRENDNHILLPREKTEIIELENKLNAKVGVLYCPTFRQSMSDIKSPCLDPSFLKFLKEEKVLWIEKRHFASKECESIADQENVLYLSSDFDINLIYKYLDIAITDYSSASSDFIYRGKKVISYIPDYEMYRDTERGFVNIYENYYPGLIAYSVKELEDAIRETKKLDYFADGSERSQKYLTCRELLFDDNSADLEWIFSNIRQKIFSDNF